MTTISPELQLLNYLEIFGHKHGAAALRKDLGIDKRGHVYWDTESKCYVGVCPELFAGGTHGDTWQEARQHLDDVIEDVGSGNPGAQSNPGFCAENWLWPGDDEAAMGVVDARIMPDCSVEELLRRKLFAKAKRENRSFVGVLARMRDTQHQFIKSDGTPIYPLPKKRGALRIFFSCLAVVLSAWCFMGVIVSGCFGESWSMYLYFGYVLGTTMWAVCAIDFWRDTAGQPLFLKPRKGGAK